MDRRRLTALERVADFKEPWHEIAAVMSFEAFDHPHHLAFGGTKQPAVGVGLGVRSREQAAEIAHFADGVIVGSALVSALAGGVPAVRTLTGELAAGVREKVAT